MTSRAGGTLETHIEPLLPTEQLIVVGRTPLARALAALGTAMGRHVVVAEPDVTKDDFPTADTIVPDLSRARIDARTAIVVAARGDADEDPVEAALATPARYVGLVASRTRGDVIRDVLERRGVSADRLTRLKYPAGLDIRARSDQEIALTILAEILQTPATARGPRGGESPSSAAHPPSAITVTITPSALTAAVPGSTYYFSG